MFKWWKKVPGVIRRNLYWLFMVSLWFGPTVYYAVTGPKVVTETVTQVIRQAERHEVKSATFVTGENTVGGTLKDGRHYKVTYPRSYEPQLTKAFDKSGTSVKAETRGFWSKYWLFFAIPMALILLIGSNIKDTVEKATGSNVEFKVEKGKNLPTERFTDVKGANEAINIMRQLVDFLKKPKYYTARGIKIPRGVLLYGPPGTGKTLSARALAGEAGVPFLFISGSDLISKWAGGTTERVRKLFEGIDPKKPIVVFFDEVDGVGTKRAGETGSDRDSNSSVVQLMHEIDELFKNNPFAVLIATTNRLDAIDPALLRDDRLGMHVAMPEPDLEGRIKILKANAARIKGVADGIDYSHLAQITAGWSGAKLAAVPNKAALLALQEAGFTEGEVENHDAVETEVVPPKPERKTIKLLGFIHLTYTPSKKPEAPKPEPEVEQSAPDIDESTLTPVLERHFIEALAISAMGVPRAHAKVPEHVAKMTAYHEGGHTLVALLTPEAPKPFRVTIIPTGPSGGSTWYVGDDEPFLSRSAAKAQLATIMGGFAAEKLILGDDFTSGPSSDRKKATELATMMVCRLGMGSTMTTVSMEYIDEHPRAAALHTEINELIREAADRAYELLTENRALLEAIKDALMEHRTIGRDLLAELVNLHAQDATPVSV